MDFASRAVFFEAICLFHATKSSKPISLEVLSGRLGITLDRCVSLLKVADEYGLVSLCDRAVKIRKTFRARRSSLPIAIRREVLAGGACKACGSTERLEVDHIIPVSREGTDEVENLQPLCYDCNRAKSDQTMDEFMAGRVC